MQLDDLNSLLAALDGRYLMIELKRSDIRNHSYTDICGMARVEVIWLLQSLAEDNDIRLACFRFGDFMCVAGMFRRATKKAVADWFDVDPEHVRSLGRVSTLHLRCLCLWCGSRKRRARGWGRVPF